MSQSVFAKNEVERLKRKLFLDGGVDVARYDSVRYPFLEKLTEKQLGFFWRPEEVDIIRDAKDFKSLNTEEKHIFTSNLKRQILLDSVQGRAPVTAFGTIASCPELETFITTWQFSETIHSRSYTHVIRNVYSDPSVVFDEMLDIQEIVDCAKDISKYYDDLIEYTTKQQAGDFAEYDEYEHKRRLWRALIAVNALEGVRFYVSFACSWAFAELKKMEGNAKIIKLICRDENIHLAATQQLIKALPKDDPDFSKIADEELETSIAIYRDVCEQEKTWARYLMQYGAMIGLNENILCQFAEHQTHKRMTAIGLPSLFPHSKANPLPWTSKWISGAEVQVAPQETEITMYIDGGIKKDIQPGAFKHFKL